MKSIRCDIIVPVFNAPKAVRACIESLKRTVDRSLDRIVVINDQSDEFTTRYLRSLEGVELIENEVNQGFLGTANRGLLLSESEFVCLLNSDTIVVDRRWLDKMVHYARSHPEVGVISPVSNEAVNLSIKMHPGADISLISKLDRPAHFGQVSRCRDRRWILHVHQERGDRTNWWIR